MKRLNTVRMRTTIAATVILAIALAVGATALLFAQRSNLTQGIESAAELRANDVAADIAGSAGKPTAVIDVRPGENILIQVVDGSGKVVASSPNAIGKQRISALQPLANQTLTQHLEKLPDGGNTDFAVAAVGVQSPAGLRIVYVAGSLEPATRSTIVLGGLLALVMPILLVVGGASTWLVTGRALRPVDEIRRRVESIENADLSRRVPVPSSNDEIADLAMTMNDMLERLQEATERQRRFVSDASHELRSPLTGMRARLEVDIAYPPGADWAETHQSLLDDTIELQSLVNDLLLLARSDAGANARPDHTLFDLDEVAFSESRRLKQVSQHNVDTTKVSGAQMFGNAADIARVVRNLLDNADRHAANTITIELHESDSEVVLSIADDGSGIARDQHSRIFERFTRLDDARTRSSGGSGLGLAIVQEITKAHGGKISVGNAPGARFLLRFPLPNVAGSVLDQN